MTMTMMQPLLIFCVLFFCEIAAQRSWIVWMRQRHVSQVQKAYGTHIDEEVKANVPSMGGVVFLLIGSGLLISQMIQGHRSGVVFWSYPILAAMVGLADDMLKFKNKSSEGLRSMQKFILQAATTLLWFLLLGLDGTIPSLWGGCSIGHWIWPVALFFAVGIQNSVNVTDGLDGLAAGASAITFAALYLLSPDSGYYGTAAGAAISLGFLWHNCHPAQVFMGDVGAHFLAGLMASCAFMGTGVLVLVPVGMGFGLEMLSVVIQLIAIHGWGKRVFRMSPIHHHFQLLGWPEDRIVVRFWMIHALCPLFCAAFAYCLLHFLLV
ncbi:phospho-N-acetylmuramoyl-pentapeptide-transferase [Pyramidobacter porci]